MITGIERLIRGIILFLGGAMFIAIIAVVLIACFSKTGEVMLRVADRVKAWSERRKEQRARRKKGDDK